MDAVPKPIPITTPDESTSATNGLLLLQVPPAVESDSVALPPTQQETGPVIALIAKTFTALISSIKENNNFFIVRYLKI